MFRLDYNAIIRPPLELHGNGTQDVCRGNPVGLMMALL